MWPTSVAMPVAVTTISPRPRVTGRVHVGHVDAVAERRRRRPPPASTDFSTGVLSPVSAASSISSVAATSSAAVGRDLVAGLEADDVARARAPRPGSRRARRPRARARVMMQHLPERRDALGRLALLVQAHHRVQHRQPDDHEPGGELLERDDADDRGPDEHELHQVAVLAQERLPAGLLRRLGELVRPVPRAPALDLARRRGPGRGSTSSRAHASSAVSPCQATTFRPVPSVGAAVAVIGSNPAFAPRARRRSASRC